jgi:hypothetical protein
MGWFPISLFHNFINFFFDIIVKSIIFKSLKHTATL